ncbi:MAG: hypothetical protein O7D95_06565 [Betaproteobacteria bacterium]|nr:hypothetical protein [Betaproteobacteria bacterium]
MDNSEHKISIQPGYVLVERSQDYKVVLSEQPAKLMEMSAACKEAGCRKVLILGHRTKVRLSTQEIFELGKEIAKLSLQIAVVELHDASKENVEFLENVVVNRGVPIQFFDNEQDAKDWLEVS